MATIKAKVVDQILTLTETPVLASGGKNVNVIEFDFDSSWSGFTKTAVFYRDKDEVYYSQVNTKNQATIPYDVIPARGIMYFGVFGSSNNDKILSSIVLPYEVVEGALNTLVEPQPPTPNIYEELLQKVNQAFTEMDNFVDRVTPIVSEAEEATQAAQNAADDARDVIDQITKDSYLHTSLQSFVDSVKASPTAYGNAIPKKIEGFTRQETTTGAQLFDINTISTQGGATYKIINDTTVEITGGKSEQNVYSNINFSMDNVKSLIQGKKIYLYCKFTGNHKPQGQLAITPASGSTTYKAVWSNSWAEVDIPSDCKNIVFGLYPTTETGTTEAVTFSDIKIGFSKFDTPEPFSGGIAAPNPDYPMEIQGTGFRGFNGLDYDYVYHNTGNSLSFNDEWISCVNKIPCKTGDNVEIIYNKANKNSMYGIIYYKGDEFVSLLGTQTGNGKFTVPSNVDGFQWQVYEGGDRPDPSQVIVKINGKYAVCVKAESPNIFNMNGRTAGSASRADMYGDTVKITTLTGSGNAPGVFFYLGPISNFLGKRLYIKADKMESSHSAEGKASCRMVLRTVKNGSSVQSFGIYQNTKAGTWMQSAEIPEDLDLNTVTNLCLQLYVGDGTAQVAVGETATFENIMVCWEKTAEYHPYQSNLTYIPVDYPLFEGDKIIQRNGEYKLVRKWKQAVFDGDENWSYGNSLFVIHPDNVRGPGVDPTDAYGAKCDSYAQTPYTTPIASMQNNTIKEDGSHYGGIYVKNTKYTDVSSFKENLQENPITIVYRINPTEEDLSPEAQKALHSIMATDGQTELTIVGVPADAGIQNQFLLPRNEDGALNTTAYCTAKRNEITLEEQATATAARLAALETQALQEV